MSNINFTHSSRRAWNSINRLTGKSSTKRNCQISPIVAKQLVKNGMYPGSDKLKRQVLRESSTLRSRNTLPDHEHLNMDLSVQKVHSASSRLKLGKAPGPDGIHNEFLMQSRKCNDFMADILLQCMLPEYLNTKDVVRCQCHLKSGKHETSPRSYRQ